MSSTSAVDIRTHAVSALSMVTSFSPGSGLRVGSARASPETHCRTAMEVPAPPLQCKPDLGRGRPDPQRCSGSAHWRQFRLIARGCVSSTAPHGPDRFLRGTTKLSGSAETITNLYHSLATHPEAR